MSVTAIVITKNEERNIVPCLDTLRWVDELVVVDAESDDHTVELAHRYTDKIFVRPWPGFGAQKNFAIERADSDWIFIVDADERVPEILRDEITRTILAGPSSDIVGFEVPRRNFFYGRWVRGGGLYPDYQRRLFRRGGAHYDDTLVHERLELHGRFVKLSSPLDHHSMPSIAHHVRKICRYTTLAAQEKLKQVSVVTMPKVGLHHLGTILKSYVLRKGYRDGVQGIIVALFAGMYTFVKYAKAWERLHVKRETPLRTDR